VNSRVCAVTGAFGYSGRYIARRLLDSNVRVVTLTNSSVEPDPFSGRVSAYPLDFNQPAQLTEALSGVDALYNTYWVRFNHRSFTHQQAVRNTRVLFGAAKQAGVRRVVHVSITNASLDSALEYFRGKAELELALVNSGMSYAILRPTVLFGREDILINNIAWMLRRLPVFGVFGDGGYRLQPIYVDDFARLAVEQGPRAENVVIDAIGPETFTYRELVATIAGIIGKKRPLVSFPPSLAYYFAAVLGRIMGDVVVTREEIRGLMDGLLYVDASPKGTTRLTQWATEHRSTLGKRYASELARRSRGRSA